MKNRKRKAQPTFAEAQPAELAQCDSERNEADGLYPHKVTLGSTKLFVPADTLVFVTLWSPLVPSLMAELDENRNGFAPSEVTAASEKKVRWRDAKRGSWRQAVYERTTYILEQSRLPQAGVNE
ncbi:hypothetical protein ABBQ38_004362 [Trebouxia sp. C0009 RCD-2024]